MGMLAFETSEVGLPMAVREEQVAAVMALRVAPAE